jgi:predicted metal-dependent HD superfamily phosphohydrolase
MGSARRRLHRKSPCLPHLGTCRQLARKAEHVFQSIRAIRYHSRVCFWHDVVYRTQNQDGSPRPDYENVRDSCELFRQYTSLSKPDADAVYDLIMATANHLQARAEKQYYAGFSGDLDLFLDLDLSSLASPWEEFVEESCSDSN